MTLDLRFDISDRVFITELKVNGTVTAIFIGDHGHQYQVRWFGSGDPHTQYFYDRELGPEQAKEDLGFKTI